MNALTRSINRLALAGLLAGPAALGCKGGDDGPPIEPKELSQVSAARSKAVMASTSKGVRFMTEDSFSLSRVGSRVTSPPVTVRSQSPVVMMARAFPPLRPLLGHAERKNTPVRQLVYQTVGEDDFSTSLDNAGQDLEVLLRDRICTDANLESKTADEAIYLLAPATTCVPLPSEGTTEADPECIDNLTKLPVRVAMTKDGDGARLRVLIGAPKFELLAFIVHSDSLAVELSLAQTKKAADLADATLSDATGAGGPVEGTKPQNLSGKVRLSLDRLDDQRFRFAASVLETVTMDVVDEMGGFLAGLSSASRPGPVFSITGDGLAKTVDVAFDVGETKIRTTWDPKDEGLQNSDLLVVLGGITGQVTGRDDQQKVVLKGLGLGNGSTHVDVRGKRIFQLDLNESDGHKVDLTMDVSDENRSAIELAPKLDLQLAFHLAEIQGDFTEPPAAELLDQTYKVVADGANPVRMESVGSDPVTGTGGGLKLTAGKLTLSSSAAPQSTVTVAAGQCLVNVEPAPGAHPILGNLAAASCQ